MKRIQYQQYGGPEVMRLEQFELEAPGKGQVAVRVRYAAINPIDWKLRMGDMKIVTAVVFRVRWGWTCPARSCRSARV